MSIYIESVGSANNFRDRCVGYNVTRRNNAIIIDTCYFTDITMIVTNIFFIVCTC